MDGAKEGFYIGIENILPAMVLGYVIIRFLELTGLVNLIGKVFAPVMEFLACRERRQLC